MSSQQLNHIEAMIDELISRCHRLDAENHNLRQEKATWQQERQVLMEKNALASQKVEAIIARLKSLEANIS